MPRSADPLRRRYPAPSPLLMMQRRAGLHPGGLQPSTLSRIAQGRGLGAFGATVVRDTTQGAATGASIGAAAGTVLPVAGNIIGAAIGAIVMGIAGALNRKDPEDANFQQASAMYRSNPASVLNIANKYLVLAGLFDLQPNQIKGNIPIYKRYGHMNEFRFVNDLAGVIQSAANTGAITAKDTPMTVFNNIVMPWINSFGYGPMQDSNGDMINAIILGMTAEYLAGAQGRWYAVGGDYPFGSLPPFKLPTSATQANAVTPAAPVPYNPVTTATPSINTPLVPMAAYAPAGSTATSGHTLVTPVGTFAVDAGSTNAQGEYRLLYNGASVGAGVQLLWDGTSVYVKHIDGSIDRWTGTSWAPQSSATALPPTVSPSAPSVPSVQVPAGFAPVSGASGALPVYVDSTGTYYQLSGTTLAPYTGTLAVNGQLVPIQNGLISQAAVVPLQGPVINPTLYQNTQAGLPSAPYQGVLSAPTPLAATPAPVTSGLSGSLPLYIGAGLAVLAVLFATARPAPAAPARS